MELADLQAFVAIAERGGFRAAADYLRVAQPSLTRRVRRLEAELGERLLERGPWGVRMTEAGRQFLQGARRVLEAVEETRRVGRGGLRHTIRLGAAATAAGSFLARFLATWIPAHPEVRLMMLEDGARNMRVRLANRECDLGIVAAPIPPAFEHRFVTTVRVQALLPRTHPLAASTEPLLVEALHRQRVLVNGDGFLSTDLLRSACRLAGVEPEVVYHCSIGQTLAALAEAGLGIAIMGDSVDLRGFDLPRRYVCDQEGRVLAFDLHVAWLREREQPAVERQFVDDLVAYVQGAEADVVGLEASGGRPVAGRAPRLQDGSAAAAGSAT